MIASYASLQKFLLQKVSNETLPHSLSFSYDYGYHYDFELCFYFLPNKLEKKVADQKQYFTERF